MKAGLETGTILIVTLILITGLSLVSIQLMNYAILNAKISHVFQSALLNQIDADNSAIIQELALIKALKAGASLNTPFVADHLEFGCLEGVWGIETLEPSLHLYRVVRDR